MFDGLIEYSIDVKVYLSALKGHYKECFEAYFSQSTHFKQVKSSFSNNIFVNPLFIFLMDYNEGSLLLVFPPILISNF